MERPQPASACLDAARGLALGAPVGRVLGYAATYTPVAGEPILVNA